MNLGKENEFIEFKESLAEKEEAMKDMGAILNKRGYGSLFFGVKNNGDVCGLEVGLKTESDIANKINSSIEPPPFYSIETKMDAEGKHFIQVDFQGKEKPYRAKGCYYLRNGEHSDLMPTTILTEMLIQSKKSYDEWENGTADCLLTDLDETKIQEVMTTGNSLNRMKHPYKDLEDSMLFLHLMNKEGKINKAGEALFSKKKPLSCRLSTLLDKEGKTYLDMTRQSGNIFELIDASYDYVLSRLDIAPVYGNGVKRGSEPEIPALALREMIVNAFGHAYYGAPFSQDIAVYPNRISIYNPGPFPSEGTPEEFAKKLIKPVDKNDRINNVLYFDDYIEHFGTGYTKTFDLLAKKKISYHYQNFNGGFLFEIYRPGKILLNPNDSDFAKLCDLLKQDRYATLNEISSYLKKSKSGISRMLSSLKQEGKLERVGSDKDGYWLLK